MSGNVRFNFMHFLPYVHLPENHKEFKSLWVDFPNKYYDPKRGHELYQRYLSELVLADRLGFDAIVVNEHHNTAYSMMAAPNLIASAIIPQTRNAKICVWGTPPNLEYPNRLAEEYAMLDVMSEGRLEVAFPLGTGMEYWANPDQPSDGARAAQGIDRHHPAGVDAGRADQILRRVLHLSVPQSVAAAVPEAASALLHRRHRQPGNGRARRRTRLRLLGGVRDQAARARAQSQAARTRGELRAHHPPRPAAARRDYLRGRDQAKGRGRGDRAHPLFLRGCAAHHAGISRSARLPVGRAAEDSRGAGRQAAWQVRLRRRQRSLLLSRWERPTRSSISSASGARPWAPTIST